MYLMFFKKVNGLLI